MRPFRGLLPAVAAMASIAPLFIVQASFASAADSPDSSLLYAPFAAGVPTAASAGATRFNAGQGGLVVWRSQGFSLPARSGGAEDDVQVSTLGVASAPGGLVLARPGGLLGTDTQDIDVRYIRRWPAALQFSRGGVDVDVSPHAGVGFSTAGGSAEAGAMLRVGSRMRNRVISGMNDMGLRTVDGARFGDRGRWYVFAAVSGESVGFNMTRDSILGLRRAGFSADASSTLISNAQAGVGWRKGDMQASVGYVQRQIQPFAGADPYASHSVGGSMVAVSFSVHGR
jgi:hypothetical protein